MRRNRPIERTVPLDWPYLAEVFTRGSGGDELLLLNAEARIPLPIRKGLSQAFLADGRNVHINYRWAEGQYERLPTMAADLVSRRVTVLVATGALVTS